MLFASMRRAAFGPVSASEILRVFRGGSCAPFNPRRVENKLVNCLFHRRRRVRRLATVPLANLPSSPRHAKADARHGVVRTTDDASVHHSHTSARTTRRAVQRNKVLPLLLLLPWRR